MEADNQLESATLMTRWWEPLRYGSAMVVAMMEAVDAEAIKVEVEANLLQTLAALILAQLQMR
jgi:hypothetical protein